MKTLHCPYESMRKQSVLLDGKEMVGGAVCLVVAKVVGWNAGLDARICENCIAKEEWNIPGVPQLPADAEPRVPTDAVARKLATKSLFFHRLCHGILRARLIGGNGRDNFAHYTDVKDVAARFMLLSSKAERKRVVKKAIEFQSVLPERHGRPASDVLRNLRELERELKVEGTLEENEVRDVGDVRSRQWRHDEMAPERPCSGCK